MLVLRSVRSVLLLTGLAGILAAALSGCGGGGRSTTQTTTTTTDGFVAPGTTPFVNSGLAGRDACKANTHVAGRARWTVLIYMNAANNLQPDSLINVAQMAAVGSNADLNIILEWKQTARSPFFTGVAVDTTPSFIGTRRYRILQHSLSDLNRIAPPGIDSNTNLVGDTTVLDPDRLADPATNTLSDQGNSTSDLGDYRALADFVQWGAKNYPADHLAVVLWDHGSGALNVDNRSAASSGGKRITRASSQIAKHTRGLSQDTQTGNQIATQELPLALANPPQPIDAIIIDCSLQGTTELAYDVRNSARVLVASEESPPAKGYPYNAWLNFLQTTASAGPCAAGLNLINDDIAAYPSDTDITQSMTDLSKMDAVATAVNAFGGTLLSETRSEAALIQTARQSAQFFDFIEYKDLYHFAGLIRQSSGAPSDLAQAAGNVQTSLLGANGATLASSHGSAADSTGFSEAKASGLSIFLPGPNTTSSVDFTAGFDPAWNQLGIAKAAPNWAAFLQAQKQ